MSNQSNSSNSKPEVLIICGPTASGKTALAIKLAGDKPTSIISADSRQIYRGLDIVTGKDIPEGFKKKTSSLVFNKRGVVFFEKDNLRLWGTDLLSAHQVYNAGEFSLLSRQIIERETDESRQVFVVGGTGFYLKALVHPESFSSVVPNDKLRQELNLLTTEELAQRLWEADPQKFVSLNQSDTSNPRRLIRAIEIASVPSLPISPIRQIGPIRPILFSWHGLSVPLEELKSKIEFRVRDRLASGAIDEVRELIEKFPDQNLPIYTTLGVRPIIRYLNGEVDRPKLEQIWVTDELNYAKRQITWFKKQPEIVWYDK